MKNNHNIQLMTQSSDKDNYAVCYFNGKIQLFQGNTDQIFQSQDYVLGLALNQNYFVYSNFESITIIDLQNYIEKMLYNENQCDFCIGLQLLDNTSLLAIGCSDNTVVIYDVLKLCKYFQFKLNTRVWALLLTQKYIICTCQSSIQFRVWGNQIACHTITGLRKQITSLQMQNELIVVSGVESFIRVYSIHNKLVRKLQSHQKNVAKALFYNSNSLVSISLDNSIKFWNLEKGEIIKSITNCNQTAAEICISNNSIYYPDGEHIKQLDLSELTSSQ